MRLNLPMRDLFSHMVMLGLAQIIEEESAEHVTVCWIDPQTAEIARLNGSAITLEEASKAVWDFKKKILSQYETICQMVDLDEDSSKNNGKNKSERSPLSPRIAQQLTDSQLESYFRIRTDILDQMSSVSPLFVRLVRALGFPSYWGESLYGNISSWDMTPRNAGNDFFRIKYLTLLKKVDALKASDVADRLCGASFDAGGEDRYANGLHCPTDTDMCLCWIAYHAFALFPVRPTTRQEAEAVTVGVLGDSMRNKTFILPIFETPITLGKYASICRFDGLYRLAAKPNSIQERFRDMQTYDAASQEKDISWLKAHGVTRYIMFDRFVGGSDKCPEFYALSGKLGVLPDSGMKR